MKNYSSLSPLIAGSIAAIATWKTYGSSTLNVDTPLLKTAVTSLPLHVFTGAVVGLSSYTAHLITSMRGPLLTIDQQNGSLNIVGSRIGITALGNLLAHASGNASTLAERGVGNIVLLGAVSEVVAEFVTHQLNLRRNKEGDDVYEEGYGM